MFRLGGVHGVVLPKHERLDFLESRFFFIPLITFDLLVSLLPGRSSDPGTH